MNWLGRTTLGMALALTALLVPATARAITVECDNAFGSCEVSNDGFDEVFCDCENGGVGSTGGNDWTGLDEEELLIVCFDQLDFCAEGKETDFATSTTTFGTDTSGSDTTDSFGTDSATTEQATTDATEGMTSTDPSTTEPSTTDPTIDPTDSGSTSGDTSGSGSSTGDGSSESTDPTTGGPAVTMSGTETSPVETSDAESSGDTGGSDGEGGCSCSTDGSGSPFAAFGLLALLGLRRRRR